MVPRSRREGHDGGIATKPAAKVSKRLCEGCCCAALMRRLIELETTFTKLAAEEADQWARAFAAAGTANHKNRNNPIIRLASARALLANINKPP
jgi:hypothetical protein